MGLYLCGLGIFNLGDQPDLLEGTAVNSGPGDYSAPHRLVVFFAGAADYYDAALAGIYCCPEKSPHSAHTFIYRSDCGRKLAAVYLGGQP